jgi:hypothetical protein
MNATNQHLETSPTHGQTVTRSPAWHLGDLSGDREMPYISYEGKGVSISTHPDVWEDILRRDGSITTEEPNTYRLENPNAEFYFVDPTNVLEKEREWAIEHGFVTEQAGYRVSYTTVSDEPAYLLFYDKDAAQAEADAREGTLEPSDVLYLDTHGEAYWEEAFKQPLLEAEPVVIEGLLPVWYAEHHGYDGVWWDEALDPSNFSAPRGVIFQSSLDNFETTIEP